MRCSIKQTEWYSFRCLITSILALSFGVESLYASTSVTTSVDNGTSAAGTLSEAILEINTTISTSPILIEAAASPLEIVGGMPPITTSLTISSSTEGSSRIINGHDFTVVYATAGVTTVSSDIIFNHSLIRSADALVILTGGSANWNGTDGGEGILDVALNAGAIEFLFDDTVDSATQSFNGNFILNIGTANDIVLSSSFYESPELIINGNIAPFGDDASVSFTSSGPSVDLGTIVLTGRNAWTGGTSLSGTILQINSPLSFPIVGGVTLNTASSLKFSLASADSYTLYSNIGGDGSGSISFHGGIVDLAGAINDFTGLFFYAGDTTLSGTCAVSMFNLQNENLTVNVTGLLNGTSGFTSVSGTDSGNSTVSIFNVNTYTGTTTVGQYTTVLVNPYAQIGNSSDPININSKGSLVNNGSIYADIITNNGMVSGSGLINGDVINNGTISPGNSPGELTIVGAFTALSDSTLEIEITPTIASSLSISGAADLNAGSVLQLAPALGCYGNLTEFAVLTASGGLTGEFSNVDSGSVLLVATTSYGPNGVLLNLSRQKLTHIGLTGNALEVGAAIDVLIDEGNTGFCNLMGEFILSSEGVISSALNQMQPALFSGLAVAQENNAVRVRDTLSYRMQEELDTVHCMTIRSKEDKESNCRNEKKDVYVWVSGMGDSLHQNSTSYASGNAVGYQDNMGGVVLGADYHFMKSLYAGILGAYTDSDVKWNNNQGKGHVKTAYTGLYFSALGEMFYGNASVIGSWNHYSADRNIDFLTTHSTAQNKHGGAQLLSHLDTGINLGWGGFTLRPFDSFDYITQIENAYTESGAGILDLHVQKRNAIMLRNELGFNFAGCFCFGSSKWTISPKISWVREVRVKGAEYTAKFKGTDESFDVMGYFPNRSLVSPGVTLAGSMWDDLFNVALYYNGEFNGKYSDHSYGGQVRIGF